MNNLNDTQYEPFTASSLARAAGVSRVYIARLCRQGAMPAVKVAGTVWVIQYEVGAAWLEARKAKLDPTES